MKTKYNSGFTVVELIIVIIVIAILAVIVIVGYNTVTRTAIESTMRSDLQNASSDLELARQRGNAYPTDPSALNGGTGLKSSGDNVISFESKPYGYCVSVTNVKTSAIYSVKSTNSETIRDGGCVLDSNKTWTGSGAFGTTDGPAGTAQFGSTAWGEVGSTVVDSQGVIFLADQGNNRIRKIALDGSVTTFAGDGTSGAIAGVGTAARLCGMSGLAIDANDNIYTSGNCSGSKLFKITPQAVVTFISITGKIAGVDPSTNIWTTENSCAKKWAQDGTLLLTVGSCSVSGYQDGTAATALFGYNPSGAVTIGGAVDRSGNLFVLDRYNKKVRKVTTDGTVSTFFGQGTITGCGSVPVDGPAATIGLCTPREILVDSTGAVWVTTKENYMFLRRIERDGSAIKTATLGTYGIKNGNQTGYLSIPEPGHISIDNKRGYIYVTGTSTYMNQIAL